MIDRTWKSRKLIAFGGAWTARDAPDIPLNKAQQSDNCEFPVPGTPKTRYGFSEAFDANEAIGSMRNWISNLGNYLVWLLAGTGIRIIDVTANPPAKSTVVSTASGVGASFADAGARYYVALFGTNGKGATEGRVISYQSSSFVGDKLFPPPLTYSPGAPSEPGAGSVTAGLHRLAYCVEYRSGALLRLSPDSGAAPPDIDSFAPVEFTSAGSKNLQWVINPTSPAWPADVVKVHIAMTPVSNPNLYVFVPGANAAVTGGGADSKTITFDISDDDLYAVIEYNDATPHRFFLTRDSDGTDDGPFDPAVVVPVGDRMGYVTTVDDGLGNDVGAFYVSNRNRFQEITADQHLIQLPGQRDIATAFYLFGNVYLLGPGWTYSTHDNGRTPVEWPTPAEVDGQKGTDAPLGVAVAPSGMHGWVASKQGLYYFNGAYAHLPISDEQSDVWRTINWNYGYQIEVLDYEERKTVMVKVPLGSAITPSHILTWNYRKGFGPDKAEYSPYTISGYDLGAMALVQNQLNGVAAGNAKKLELWLGPSDADAILRQKTASDANPYNDADAGIISIFKTALLPGPIKETQILQHHGGHFGVEGDGSLVLKIHNLDDTWDRPLRSIALQTSPGKAIFRGTYRIADLVAYSFTTSAADSWFQLSELQVYHSPYARHR